MSAPEEIDYNLSTRLVNLRLKRKNQQIKSIRSMRIEEAINWKAGPSQNRPLKYVVNLLPDGLEVYFLKPGKEAFRPNSPNIYDMTPMVGNVYQRATFESIWAYLSRISIINFEFFKLVLVLIYRSAFLIDHVNLDAGIRYRPDKNVMRSIGRIQDAVGEALPEGGLLGLLNFLDVLGWNEDVKYHTEDGKPGFGRHGFRVGRVNTLLTCIRVPFQLSLFVKNTIETAKEPQTIDFGLGSMMQQFARSRGTCAPSDGQILNWLSPYIHR